VITDNASETDLSTKALETIQKIEISSTG